MAKNCRQVALKEYGIETQARRHVEVYESLLENHAKGNGRDTRNAPDGSHAYSR